MYVIWAALTFASIQVTIQSVGSRKQNDDVCLLIMGNPKIPWRLTCGLSALDGLEVKLVFLELSSCPTAKAVIRKDRKSRMVISSEGF